MHLLNNYWWDSYRADTVLDSKDAGNQAGRAALLLKFKEGNCLLKQRSSPVKCRGWFQIVLNAAEEIKQDNMIESNLEGV